MSSVARSLADVRRQRGYVHTVAEMRAGHSAYNHGGRSPEVVRRELAYQAWRKRVQRARPSLGDDEAAA